MEGQGAEDNDLPSWEPTLARRVAFTIRSKSHKQIIAYCNYATYAEIPKTLLLVKVATSVTRFWRNFFKFLGKFLV